MNVIIINTQSGDWEAIYINGDFIEEGHEIDRMKLLELSREYNFGMESIQLTELDDEDEDVVARHGNMEGVINISKYTK